MDERRRFGIADGMILTAGVAGGLALVRWVDPQLTPRRLWDAVVGPGEGWTPRYAFEFVVELGVVIGIPLLAAWSPACLLIQLIKPRPRWRRLRRQSGFVACLLPSVAAVLTAAVALACSGLGLWSPGTPSPDYLLAPCLGVGVLGGTSVLWAWVTMALGGTWRARPTWTDRLGRLTGMGCVVVGTTSLLYIILVS